MHTGIDNRNARLIHNTNRTLTCRFEPNDIDLGPGFIHANQLARDRRQIPWPRNAKQNGLRARSSKRKQRKLLPSEAAILIRRGCHLGQSIANTHHSAAVEADFSSNNRPIVDRTKDNSVQYKGWGRAIGGRTLGRRGFALLDWLDVDPLQRRAARQARWLAKRAHLSMNVFAHINRRWLRAIARSQPNDAYDNNEQYRPQPR